MSKINAVRFINLKYNNNAIRISDETFHLNGESTLLSLRNGGGKSVLVQMMTAPFVHKRYRDAKDRPFESYFTTSKPSFILVEWVLDKGAGYVLTGMMVRRNQEMNGGSGENLEMIHFISEYRESCLVDIHHLPVVEKGKKEILLKGFTVCRQIFEEYKKDRSLKFFCYDMGNSAQSRQYFDKLMEYQINYKEWETIIKKVNLKESGLSELFADCKDEKGLVEKWFLDAVENKLNKDKNRITEFQSIVGKYVGQYKDNRSKIKRRDTIRLFKEEGLQIQEKAEVYERAEDELHVQENKIANFLMELNRLRDLSNKEYENIRNQIEDIRLEIAHTEYEKLSGEVYTLTEDQGFHISNRMMLEMEQEEMQQEENKIMTQLHKLECAKQRDIVEKEEKEYNEAKQRLFVSRQEEADMEPERNRLGSLLKSHYQQILENNREKQKSNREKYHQVTEEILADKKRISNLEEEMKHLASEKGALNERIRTFDRQEEYFNKHYQEHLMRNILGEYEPGMLDIQRDSYEKELEKEKRSRNDKIKQKENGKEHIKRLQRRQEEIRKNLDRILWEKDRQEELHAKYEKELEVRGIILKYLGLDTSSLFDEDKILKVSEHKLEEIAEYKRNLEKEEDILQRELQKLTGGKALELPEELEKELKNMGIPIIYGMEWLKKNGYSEEKNREMVCQQPFLPYSLIFSEQDLEKLSGSTGNVYTSFPIPIVKREQLDKLTIRENGSVLRLPGISFYVYFNENLLNEEKLADLVAEKEQQIICKKEAIDIRNNEYKEYFQRQEVIKNQEVNRKLYESNDVQIEELKNRSEEMEGNLQHTTKELSEQTELNEKLEEEIKEAEGRIVYQQRRLEDYIQLCTAYEEYEQNSRALENSKKEEERLSEKKKLLQERMDKLDEQSRTLENEKEHLKITEKEQREAFLRYQGYEASETDRNCEVESGKSLAIEEAEARFKAITEKMSQEVKLLEEQEQKAGKRYQEALDELKRLSEKYDLKADLWRDIGYDIQEEIHQENRLKEMGERIKEKNRLWTEEDKIIAVIAERIEACMKRMISECNKERPLPKVEIRNKDFEAVKNQLEHHKLDLIHQEEGLKTRLQSYDENLTALAEYDIFIVKETISWEEDFSKLNQEQLRKSMGIFVRDYKQAIENRRKAKDRLQEILNRIIRKEEFQEDYYRKPLEAMLELLEDVTQVQKQLQTAIQSYDDLMEKLEVDISMVEKERDKILELMEDYIREVHLNLGKIDSNSTITIRERSLKMLRIQLPEWEANENLYHIRLLDMIDGITQKGIELFEKNENAQEYFGTQITTRNLYDTVIGIGNVQIKLYKIEEQREYPITWAEVARNSGGEGFLSAFVILSSLLYYIRKDDTDLFSDRNEGKVLVMDNPFAQTNASHLLKPLMDMAKKTNTQLICLTGLGGESIYNRFDNIYVLNLISASLRTGMQYLKVNHMKGNEPENLIVSQIEVVEQQELPLF